MRIFDLRSCWKCTRRHATQRLREGVKHGCVRVCGEGEEETEDDVKKKETLYPLLKCGPSFVPQKKISLFGLWRL